MVIAEICTLPTPESFSNLSKKCECFLFIYKYDGWIAIR